VFLGYNNQHKGFKCLDVAEGRVYVSRDVIFDETIYPFSKLHSNAGAQLRNEILLLPSHPVDHSGICLPNNEPTLVDAPNPCSVHTEAGH
jgi:hypothetical protein